MVYKNTQGGGEGFRLSAYGLYMVLTRLSCHDIYMSVRQDLSHPLHKAMLLIMAQPSKHKIFV